MARTWMATIAVVAVSVTASGQQGGRPMSPEGSAQTQVLGKWVKADRPTFALGREPGEADACSVEQIQNALSESDGDLRELLVAIATSDAFRYRIVDGGAP